MSSVNFSKIYTPFLIVLIAGLDMSGGAAYSAPEQFPNQSPVLQIAQSVDIDMDSEDRDSDDDSNEPESRRTGTRRISTGSDGCGATVRVGKISLASCLANRSAASAVRTFSRSSRNTCRNTVSQSSTQSTTVNGVTRRSSQSNVTCQ